MVAPERQEQGLTNSRATAGGLMTGRRWGAFSFLFPVKGTQIFRAHLVTHWPALIRLLFLPATNSCSRLLLNTSFPDTGSPGCHPRLKPTQTMLCVQKSLGRFSVPTNSVEWHRHQPLTVPSSLGLTGAPLIPGMEGRELSVVNNFMHL